MKTSDCGKCRKINFKVAAEPGSEVFVAGTFNNWDPRNQPMPANPTSGYYKTAIALPPGRHEYKFIINGEWRVDANCPDWVPNDHGSLNSVITV